MKRKIWQIGLLAVLILALAAPVALAQDTTGDKLVIGQSFVLAEGEELTGNLAVLGGSATLEEGSVVRGDVAVLGGSLTVAGAVDGDVALFGGALSLKETAVVGGNVATFGGAITRDPRAVVSGDVFTGLPAPFPLPLPGIPEAPAAPTAPWPPASPRAARGDGFLGIVGAIVLWQLVTFGWVLGLILLGALAISIAPKALERMANQAAGEPLVSFGAGLLTLVAGFLAGLLLLIACCIGLLGWLALAIAWLAGWLVVGLWLGQRILQALKVRTATSLGEIATGLAVITILSRLPWCIGFMFGLVFGCIGLGAVVMTRFGMQPGAGGSRGTGEPGNKETGKQGDVSPAVAGLLTEPRVAPAVEPELEWPVVSDAAPAAPADEPGPGIEAAER